MAKTVLIVDDLVFVRRTLSDIFTQAHYQVIGEAANGADAIQQYVKLRPDIVTMDVVMPEMSGIEATRKICMMDKDAKIIIISAMGQENLVMEAINVGAKDYILKPFSRDDVIKTADKAVRGDSFAPARGSPREKTT